MAIVNVGRVRPVWQGTWSSSTAYVKDDIVFHDNSSWIAKTSSTNSAPAISNTDWDQMSVGTPDIPNQAGQGDKFLQTDGSDLSWSTVDVAGGTETTTMTGNLTLTSDSKRHQVVTSDQARSVILPDATTLTNGIVYTIVNEGSYNISITNQSSELISTATTAQIINVYLKDNSTSDGTWALAIGSTQGKYTLGAAKADTTVASFSGSTIRGIGQLTRCGTNSVLTATIDGLTDIKLQVHTYDPNTASWSTGSAATVTINNTNDKTIQLKMVRLTDSQHAIAYWDYAGSNANTPYFRCNAISVTGNAVSVGSNLQLNNDLEHNTEGWTIQIIRISDTVFATCNSGYQGGSWDTYVNVVQVSGTSASNYTYSLGRFANWPGITGFYDSTNNILHTTESSNNSGHYYYWLGFPISGYTIGSSTSYDKDTFDSAWRGQRTVDYVTGENRWGCCSYGANSIKIAFGTFTNNQIDDEATTEVPNATRDTNNSIIFISKTGTVETWGLFTGTNGGLAGAGTSFREVYYDTSTNIISYSSLSLVAQNFGITNYISNVEDGGGSIAGVIDAGIVLLGRNLENNYEIQLVALSNK